MTSATLPHRSPPLAAEIPDKTSLAGIEVGGFRVLTASDLQFAQELVAYARQTHCCGGEHYIHDNTTQRIVRWAVVEAIA